MARAVCLAVLGSLSLPAPTPLLPPGAGVRGAWVPLGPGLYLNPLHEALGSRRCECSLAVVLCLRVSLLGIIEFVVFSKIYMVLGEISAVLLNTTILVLPS